LNATWLFDWPFQIKTRRDVDNLGFEKWDKIQCEGGIQALNEKLATLGHCSPPPDLPHIRLAKRRTRCKGPRCTFEETDVVVRYHAAPSTEDRVNSVGNGGAPVPLDSLSEEVWRSVAVEGKRKACTNLQATLLLRVAAAAGPGARILVCGYAEFVATMAAQDDAEATKATMAIEDASDVPGGAQLGRASI